MSLVQEILYAVSNYPGGYRLIYDIIYDSQPPESRQKQRNLYDTGKSTLSRLKKKGLVKYVGGEWRITSAGLGYLKSKTDAIRSFITGKKAPAKGRKLIIIFDIPETRKRYREWLRSELIGFGFTLVQKSVWFGPPLPHEFVEYLEEVGLLKHIRFFKVAEQDLV